MVGIIDQNRCLGDRYVLLQFMEEQHSDRYQTDSTGTPRVEIRLRLKKRKDILRCVNTHIMQCAQQYSKSTVNRSR